MKSTTRQAKSEKPTPADKRKASTASPAKTGAKTGAKPGDSANNDATKTVGGTATSATPPQSSTLPQSSSESDKRKGGNAFLLWIVALVVVLLIGTGAATWPFWSPYINASKGVPGQLSISEKVNNLEKKMASNANNGNAIQDLIDEKNRINKKLNTLVVKMDSMDEALKSVKLMVEATTLPSPQAVNANKSLQKLSERFAKIEKSGISLGDLLQRMDKLEKNAPAPQDRSATIDKRLSAAINAISQRVGSLEKTITSAPPGGSTALMLAVSQLREGLLSTAPFSKQLDALVALTGSSSEIADSLKEIKPYASSGIASLNLLRRQFPDVSRSINSGAPTTTGNGWLDNVKAQISLLVSVHRVDGKTAAVISRTEKLLDDGDLAGAIKVMDRYSSTSPRVASWIRAARARLTAESTIAALHVFALSLITPREEQAQ